MNNIEDTVQTTRSNFVQGIKKRIFDLISLVIIVAIVTASLDIFDIIDLKEFDFFRFIVSWVPYFLAATLLNANLYKKGSYVGHLTDKFISVIDEYSDIVNSLSGEQIKGLYKFCDDYNKNAKKLIQTSILREKAVSYDDFELGVFENNTRVLLPLKVLSKEELFNNKYTKEQVKAICKAKRVKIKGINVNVLLSTINTSDITSIGNDEKTLEKRQLISTSIGYAVRTILLSFIAINDISQWGWAGAVLVLFKLAYIFAGSYISYFHGYDDVTKNAANYFIRKTDILKMYTNYVAKETSDEA